MWWWTADYWSRAASARAWGSWLARPGNHPFVVGPRKQVEVVGSSDLDISASGAEVNLNDWRSDLRAPRSSS